MKRFAQFFLALVLATNAVACGTSTYNRRTANSKTTSVSGPGGNMTDIDERDQLYDSASPLFKCIALEMSAVPKAPDDPRFAAAYSYAIRTCKGENGVGYGVAGYGNMPIVMMNPGMGALNVEGASQPVMMNGASGSGGQSSQDDADLLMAVRHYQCRYEHKCLSK